MHEPTRELLNTDPKSLDVPSVPKPALNERGPETPGYDLPSPDESFFVTPIQGQTHPTMDQAYAKGTAWDEVIPDGVY